MVPLFRAMVRNRVFFQHPDMLRCLRIHENVMAIMMNTLGRRAQQQQADSGQADTDMEGMEGMPIQKEVPEVSRAKARLEREESAKPDVSTLKISFLCPGINLGGSF